MMLLGNGNIETSWETTNSYPQCVKHATLPHGRHSSATHSKRNDYDVANLLGHPVNILCRYDQVWCIFDYQVLSHTKMWYECHVLCHVSAMWHVFCGSFGTQNWMVYQWVDGSISIHLYQSHFKSCRDFHFTCLLNPCPQVELFFTAWCIDDPASIGNHWHGQIIPDTFWGHDEPLSSGSAAILEKQGGGWIKWVEVKTSEYASEYVKKPRYGIT